MIAQRFGQDPREVANWEPEWLAATSTLMEAEAGAQTELKRRADRQGGRRMGGR